MFRINDINTYPERFKEFCNARVECLNNTIGKNIEEFHIDSESYLFSELYKILKNEEVELIQASRLADKNSIIRNGILNPACSNKMSDIILKPISEKLGRELLSRIKIKMDEMILRDEKYNKIHFVVGEMSHINIENGFLMLNNYGGELLEDVFSELRMKEYYDKNIAPIGEPYAIFFKQAIRNLEADFQEEVFKNMICKYVRDYGEPVFKENYIFHNVAKKDILDIKRVNLEE